jgi:hypothetical protein
LDCSGFTSEIVGNDFNLRDNESISSKTLLKSTALPYDEGSSDRETYGSIQVVVFFDFVDRRPKNKWWINNHDIEFGVILLLKFPSGLQMFKMTLKVR